MSTIPNSPPAIQRFFTSRDNNANSATYVGQEQRLWYDPVSNAIYVSDGNTAGGILVGGGGSGNGVPGGPTNSVQLNAGNGSFAGTSNLIFDGTTLSVVGNVSGTYFIGNGALLTGINANANYSNSNVESFLQVLTSNVSTTGNISASYYFGNGSQLTGIIADTGNLRFSNTTIFPTTSLANIRLQTYDTANSITSNWVFGKNTLYLPDTSTVFGNTNTTIVTGDFVSGNSSQIQLLPTQFVIQSSDSSDPANVSAVTMSARSLKSNPYFSMSVSDPSQSTTQVWSFDKTGTFNLPSGGVIFDTPNGALAFGYQAGGGNANISQGSYGISIGASSGEYNQGDYSIAFGYNAGNNIQGTNSVAIGKNAGGNNQGNNAIYIGGTANTTIQVDNSIVLNASGNSFNANVSGFFVKPVRSATGNIGNVAVYNANTGEVTYSSSISLTGNVTANYIFGNGINLTGLANITFGSAPPANAIIGDTWIDSTTGIQYVYFNDITGNIWAEMEAQTTYASVGYANLTTNTLNTQVLYNASNAIVGSNNLTFDGTTLSAQGVTVGNALQISGNSIVSTTSNANLTIDTSGSAAYINMRGGLKLTSYNGNLLMETIDDTVNFYTPILDSTDSALDIIGTIDGNTLPPETSGVMLHITGQPTLPSRIYNDGINTYAGYIGRAYNGNVSVPTAILANTIVSRFGSLPYSNVGFPALTTTRIDMVTTENQTSSNLGSQINFWSTPTGSNTIAQTATLNSTALSVTGNVVSLGIVNSRNFIANVTSTVSSSANVTLTATSNYNQVITGTAAQNFFLPNATTLNPGTGFLFNVNSSQPTYIYYQDATLLATIPAGGITLFRLLSNGTANGSWDRHSLIPSYAGWGSSALAMGGANITGGSNISVTGIVSATGNVIGGNVRASTVNTIPTLYTNLIAVAGSRAFITDGNLIASGNFGNQVSGGGSNTVPVWSNGTNWYIG